MGLGLGIKEIMSKGREYGGKKCKRGSGDVFTFSPPRKYPRGFQMQAYDWFGPQPTPLHSHVIVTAHAYSDHNWVF